MGYVKEASYSTPHEPKLSLEQAPSAAELLRALRDVVLVLESLFSDYQTLHRHIDFNNILIEKKDGIRGVVVDLDYPDPLDGSCNDGAKRFQMCRPLAFQTLDQLRANDRRVSDDVKSLFYVLCWAIIQWVSMRHNASDECVRIKRDFEKNEIPFYVNRFMGCQRDIMEGDDKSAIIKALKILDKGINKLGRESCGV
ncbi:hypothetical protein FB45DRAFT_896274 [Roridomyces roridus]|uniref:Fungal-type protein kinase domain-containing protein n=1 Tax=Roridomyces roridus TaxID=1738132 RepID=A0AAD7CAD2_9AGAR|nr:hypothetical protein FB45DRAFT_896274 [Roridomyces roridus]